MPSSLKAQRATPQANARLIRVTDLSGGLDLRKAATLLKPNRSRMCRNWSLREPGSLVSYPGWETFTETSLGSGRPQGGQRIYLGNGAPFTLAAWNGSVYMPSDSGTWGAPVSTGWDPTAAIFFPYDRDIVAIFDGTTAPKKSVDGLTWTNFGIAAPAAAPTAAALAGGSLVDGSTYEFSYSGRDDALLHESNESARVTIVPSGGNLSARLTLTFHPDTQVDTLIVYGRDTTAGELVRRRITTVANPGAGTVTVDVTTNNWSSGTEAPNDHDVPPMLSFGVPWKNRWWARDAVVKNRVRFTQIFEPQSWPAEFFIDIPFERGDDISAFSPQGDILVTWGNSKPFLIIGQTSLDFEVRPVGAAQAGALGPRAVDALEEGIIHAASEGIYLFDGASDRLLSYDIDGLAPAAIGWRSYVTTASASDLEKTPLVYHQAAKEVAIGVTNLYPFGTPGEWILDLNRTRLQEVPAWTSTDRVIGGYIKWDGNEPVIGARGRLFSWSATDGELNEERTGTSANGADLVGSYSGPVFAMTPYIASLIDGYISFEPNNVGTFGMAVIVDGNDLGSQTIDITGGGPILGTAVLGTAVLGGSTKKQVPIVLPLDAEGLTFQVDLTYTGQATFRIFEYGIGLVPEPAISGF
jgi:hypothetical protein